MFSFPSFQECHYIMEKQAPFLAFLLISFFLLQSIKIPCHVTNKCLNCFVPAKDMNKTYKLLIFQGSEKAEIYFLVSWQC